MATEAFSSETIALLDGTEVELRPLSVYNMRKFMKIWTECIVKVQKAFQDAADLLKDDDNAVSMADIQNKTSEMQYDAWVPMCAIALEAELKGERSDKAFKDYLERTLDEATIFRILDVCGNLKLGPDAPNQTPAVTETE